MFRIQLFSAGTEREDSAVVGADDLSVHVVSGGLAAGIHVCKKTDRGEMVESRGRGNGSEKAAVPVQADVPDADPAHLFREVFREDELSGRRGMRSAVLIGRCLIFHIFHQPLCSIHDIPLSCSGSLPDVQNHLLRRSFFPSVFIR